MTDDLFRGLRDEAGALDQQHQFLQAACFQSPEAMIARKAVIDFDVGSLTTFDLVIYEDPHINACYSFGEVLAVEDWVYMNNNMPNIHYTYMGNNFWHH